MQLLAASTALCARHAVEHEMTLERAREALLECLNRNVDTDDEECALLEQFTIEKPYGWVFIYNAKRYVETGDFAHALVGNGPVVVERTTLRITPLGTAFPVDETVARFEREHQLGG